MTESLIKELKNATSIYHELKKQYNHLPVAIIKGCTQIIEKVLPQKVNEIIVIINSVENNKQYKQINNIQEAIEFFEEFEIIETIKNISNKETDLYSVPLNKKLSKSEIIEELLGDIKLNVRHINLVLATGRNNNTNN